MMPVLIFLLFVSFLVNVLLFLMFINAKKVPINCTPLKIGNKYLVTSSKYFNEHDRNVIASWLGGKTLFISGVCKIEDMLEPSRDEMVLVYGNFDSEEKDTITEFFPHNRVLFLKTDNDLTLAKDTLHIESQRRLDELDDWFKRNKKK